MFIFHPTTSSKEILWEEGYGYDEENDVSNTRTVDSADDVVPRNLRDKHLNQISSLSLSNDNTLLYSGSFDGKVKCWAAPTVTSIFDREQATVPYLGQAKDVGSLVAEFQVGAQVTAVAHGSEVPIGRAVFTEINHGAKLEETPLERCTRDKFYACTSEDVVSIWDAKPEESSTFRNKGELRSVSLEELITPLLDIGTLTMQMLGFPFGEDMPWSEEVEPIQYTLPIFQMEFKVTPQLFLFQFWCISCFCIVFIILCLGDAHEKLMDEIARSMGDSTYEQFEEMELEEDKEGKEGGKSLRFAKS